MGWNKLSNAGRTRLVRIVVALMMTIMVSSIAFSFQGMPVSAAQQAQSGQPNAGTLAIVGASGAQLYSAPGGEALQQLAPGTVLTAVGRAADNLWVVVHNDADLAGWVETSEVVLFGIEQLPVMVEGNVAEAVPSAGTQQGAAVQEPLLPTPTQTPLPTPTPLPTATFTPTPVPTATPTPLPTATAAPPPTTSSTVSSPSGGATASGEQSLVAVVRGGGADLYDRPDGTVTERLPTGTAVTAWGRSDDNQWLVVVASSGLAGWVQVAGVVVFNTEVLPVLDVTSGSPVGGTANSVAPATAPAATDSSAVPGSGDATSGPAVTEDTPTTEEAAGTASPNTGLNEVTASVTVTDSRLNIRSGPGTNYGIVDKADPGDVFIVGGRNVEATWIEVALPDNEAGYGWVSADFVELSRPILGVPVSARLSDIAPASTVAPVAVSNLRSAPAGLSGRLVFQATNGGDIYTYDLASGALSLLTGGFDPAISPDGKTVAFTRFGGDHGLYLIDIDGKNERLLWNGSEGLRAPTWSPDGQWIGFVRVAGEYNCRDLGFGICLPDNPFLGDFPVTSVPEYNLSRVDSNGENFRDIPALNTAQAPDWHDAGIVYQASTGIEITTDTPDAETRAVVQAPFYQDPTWQPSGDRILFQSREGSHWEIFTVNTDGNGLAALTRPVTALVEDLPSNVAPAWSPDGQWIVFLSNRDDENDAGPWRLWVMAADGSNQRPLPVDVEIEYTYGNEQAVSWGVAG